MYHIVYKTTNLINNKFYIGVHKSAKLMDEYLGSGKWISRSIKKYGRENFKRENLFIYFDSASAYGKEAELVSLHLKDPLCMNLKQGGMGGFDYINENFENIYEAVNKNRKNAKKARNKLKDLLKDSEYKSNFISICTKNLLKNLDKIKEGSIKGRLECIKYWTGRKHSEETKEKIREASTGSKNSQYGTCWITNEGINKKIKKEELQTWLDQGWKRGRK